MSHNRFQKKKIHKSFSGRAWQIGEGVRKRVLIIISEHTRSQRNPSEVNFKVIDVKLSEIRDFVQTNFIILYSYNFYLSNYIHIQSAWFETSSNDIFKYCIYLMLCFPELDNIFYLYLNRWQRFSNLLEIRVYFIFVCTT